MKLSDIPNVTIPKQLGVCPILEAVIEVRFNTSIDDDAIFGAIYEKVRSEWKSVEKLPVLEIPAFVRKQDPNLKFAPHYRLVKDNLLLQIGPNVLSLVNRGQYKGSETFFQEFDSVLDKIQPMNLFERFLRVGIRYIDFFEQNIFQNLRLSFSIAEQSIDYSRSQVRTVVDGEDNFLLGTSIAGDVFAADAKKKGFVFDVDAYREALEGVNSEQIKKLIRSAHSQQKRLFFGLLKEDFLASLKPTYEEKI